MTTSRRRIVITGATGGIGTALARRLTDPDTAVAVTGRSAEAVTGLVDELGDDLAWGRAVQLTDEPDVADFYAEVARRWGTATAVVNLAGASTPGPIGSTSVETFHELWQANVTTAFLSGKHALSVFDRADAPMMINVSSVAGVRPNATAPVYCTAKAALDMFSRAFALEVADRGIRVAALSPGGTDTAFWGDRPVNRAALLSADVVAETIAFVLGLPATAQITSLVLEPFNS